MFPIEVIRIGLEHLKMQTDPLKVAQSIGEEIQEKLEQETLMPIQNFEDFQKIFLRERLKKPLILILDEFKAKKESYRFRVLELFKTQKKAPFSFDDEDLNYLYMNGVIDYEKVEREYFCKFPNPFVQKSFLIISPENYLRIKKDFMIPSMKI